MTIDIFSEFISNVGFPIAVTGALFYQMSKTNEANNRTFLEFKEIIKENTMTIMQMNDMIKELRKVVTEMKYERKSLREERTNNDV